MVLFGRGKVQAEVQPGGGGEGFVGSLQAGVQEETWGCVQELKQREEC